jgi:hypothetical protein
MKAALRQDRTETATATAAELPVLARDVASSSPLLSQVQEADGGGGGGSGSEAEVDDLYTSLVPDPHDAGQQGIRRGTSSAKDERRGGADTARPPSAARRRQLTALPAVTLAATFFLGIVLIIVSKLVMPPPMPFSPEGQHGGHTIILSLSQNRSIALNLTAQQAGRAERYKSGKALMLFLHLTHHGGTFFCGVFSKARGLRSPNFACRIDRNVEELDSNLTADPRFFYRVPWHANETQVMIDVIRPHYEMISFEFGFVKPTFPIQETDWDNPNLLSIFISRHPLDRMLAGDGYVNTHFNIRDPNATLDDWWAYANTTHGDTDNFMLRVLSDPARCCQGADTPRERLDEAIELLGRFTFVLDLRCLDEGMEALAGILGVDLGDSLKTHSRLAHPHPEISSRFPHREVYGFLLERNKLDIELYEWTQQRALVNCEDLRS